MSVCHPRVNGKGRKQRASPASAAGASLFHTMLPPPSLPYCLLGPWLRTVPVSALRRSTQRVSHSIDWIKMPRLSWLHLKEEMGRHQCKNSSNYLKNNILSESNKHTTGRLQYPNSEEVEEIDLKHNIMKVIESLKQDVKNSLKEMDELSPVFQCESPSPSPSISECGWPGVSLKNH